MNINNKILITASYDSKNDINKFPKRQDYLIHNDDIQLNYENKKELNFLPHQVEENILYKSYGKNNNNNNNDDRQITETVLNIYGILENGEKALCVLSGLDKYIYYDIFPKQKYSEENNLQFEEKLVQIETNTQYIKIRTKMKQFLDDIPMQKIFCDKELICKKIVNRKWHHSPWYMGYRFYFKSVKDLKESLFAIKNNNNIDIYSNGLKHFPNVIGRRSNKSLCNWVILSNYTTNDKLNNYDLNKYKNIDKLFRLDIKDYKNHPNPAKLSGKDYIFTLNLDLETILYTPSNASTTDIVDPNTIIICIGLSITRGNCPDSICNVVIYDCKKPKKLLKDHVLIKCSDQKDMLLTLGQIWKNFYPENLQTYNGGDFDNPMLMLLLKKYNIVEKFFKLINPNYIYEDSKKSKEEREKNIWTYNFCTRPDINPKATDGRIKVKLTPDVMIESTIFKIPGMLDIDLQVLCRKKFPKLKYSLNSMLQTLNLTLKKDMPYHLLNAIYNYYTDYYDNNIATIQLEQLYEYFNEANDIEDLILLVFEYCTHDANACQQLMTHKQMNIMINKRIMASETNTMIINGFYHADVMKIENTIFSLDQDAIFLEEFLRSDDKQKKVNYPGAHVECNVKELTPEHDTGFKFKLDKLKKHLISTISHYDNSKRSKVKQVEYEKIYTFLLDAKANNKADELRKFYLLINNESTDKELIRIINTGLKIRNGIEQYPTSDFDFKSLYPNLIINYNISPDYLIPTKKLITEAIKINKENVLQDSIEINNTKQDISIFMHYNNPKYFGIIPKLMMKWIKAREWLDSLKKEAEKAENEDEIIYYDAAQLAVKILLNTTYGALAYENSILFVPILAAIITHFGRKNITESMDFARSLQYMPKLCDTDSQYVKHPKSIYKHIDKSLRIKEYKKQCIIAAIKDCDQFGARLNNFLADKHKGMRYLRFAREVTMLPALYPGMKMYIGLEHIHNVNENPDINFNTRKGWRVKGFQFVKGDASKLLIKFCREIFWEILDITYVGIPLNTIQNKLTEFYTMSWNDDLSYFTKNKIYKDFKQNITLNSFRNRMIDEINTIKFNYETTKNEKYKELLACYKVPTNLEKFQIILVQKEKEFDIRGRNLDIKRADQFEYPEVVKYNNLKIDLNYYMASTFASIGKILSANYLFRYSKSNDDKIKLSDKDTSKKAVSYFEKYCKKYNIDIIENENMLIKKKQYANFYKKYYNIYINNMIKKYGYKYKQILNWFEKFNNGKEILTNGIPSLLKKINIKCSNDYKLLKPIIENKHSYHEIIKTFCMNRYNNLTKEFYIEIISAKKMEENKKNQINKNDDIIDNNVFYNLANIINSNNIDDRLIKNDLIIKILENKNDEKDDKNVATIIANDLTEKKTIIKTKTNNRLNTLYNTYNKRLAAIFKIFRDKNINNIPFDINDFYINIDDLLIEFDYYIELINELIKLSGIINYLS